MIHDTIFIVMTEPIAETAALADAVSSVIGIVGA